MSKKYDRLPKESDPAWEAFVMYRDMGLGRSLGKVARQLGKSKTLLDRWSQKNRWRVRVVAWDEDLDRRQREGMVRELVRMRERQVRASTALQSLGVSELNKLIDRSRQAKEPILKPKEVLNMIARGAELERLNRGEPSQIVETNGSVEHSGATKVDYSGLSSDELRALKRISAKARKQTEENGQEG